MPNPNRELAYYEGLKYRREFRFDPEEAVWVVRLPELPGCVAHGETIEDANKLAEAFKSEWLDNALHTGEPIPEPEPEQTYSGKFVVRLPKSMHQGLAELAQEEGVSQNSIVARAIAEFLHRSGLIGAIRQVLSRVEAISVTVAAYGHAGHEIDAAQAAVMEGAPSIESHGG